MKLGGAASADKPRFPQPQPLDVRYTPKAIVANAPTIMYANPACSSGSVKTHGNSISGIIDQAAGLRRHAFFPPIGMARPHAGGEPFARHREKAQPALEALRGRHLAQDFDLDGERSVGARFFSSMKR